jgi:hypothetical protein
MSKSKAIGTAAETAATRYLQANGFPACDRQPLRGNRDQGDLIVCRTPRVIAEVKGGQMAETASAAVIAEWLEQTETEAVHAGADLGVLIVRRFRRPVGLWDAYMPSADWALLLTGESLLTRDAPWPLRSSLADWARMASWWAEGLQ